MACVAQRGERCEFGLVGLRGVRSRFASHLLTELSHAPGAASHLPVTVHLSHWGTVLRRLVVSYRL